MMLFIFLLNLFYMTTALAGLFLDYETALLWLNNALVAIFDVGIFLERRIVYILDRFYANTEVPAYTIHRVRGFQGSSVYYFDRTKDAHHEYFKLCSYLILDATYNPTNANYQIPILTNEQYMYIKNQRAKISEPTYRFLKRSKASTLNIVSDHRQIISACASTGMETHDVDLDIVHRLAGPCGDFFADLPGDRTEYRRKIREFIEYETALSNIKEIECFLSTGDNILL